MVEKACSLSIRRKRAAMRAALAISLASPALVPGRAWAQTAPATQASTQPATRATNGNGNASTRGVTSQPGGGLMLNFRDASIDAVLDELSAAAGFIVVKQVKPEGRVTLVSKQPVTADDAVPLLNSVLRNAGYAAIQQGRILKIVPKDEAKKANIPVYVGSDPTQIEPTDELITQVIPLKSVDARQLKEDLEPIRSPEADFTANQSSNALVITDTAAHIRRIVEIVSALDSNLSESAEVKVLQLEYANAANAAKLVNDLFGTDAQRQSQNQSQQSQSPFAQFFNRDRGSSSDRERSRSSDAGQVRGARIFAASDERTNIVVVTGSAAALEVIAKVVKELDENPSADETVFIYHLKNADAANVESTVNVLFNGGTSNGSSRSGRSRQGNAISNRSSTSGGGFGGGGGNRGGTGSTFGGNSSGFGSSSSSRFGGGTSGFGGGGFGSGGFGGSAGLSSGAQNTASQLAGQVSIIADPDTNALLVRTSPKYLDRVKTILDELDRAVPQVLIKVLIAEVTHDNSSDFGFEFSILNMRTAPSPDRGVQGGTDFGVDNATGGVVVSLLEQNVSATLRALETAGKLDVLSRPYILASDNQLASITVGQVVPFVTSNRITDDGDTINSVDYNEVGILLDVVPHINPEGLVILDVVPTISALTGSSVAISDGAAIPIVAKRSAESRVAVKNGETIVIGGLMEDRKTETVSKLPVLGDIPILGNLFRRTIKSKVKTELLIFLTPHVAAAPEVLKGMSQEEIDGTKLVPYSDPKVYQEHIEGLKRGGKTSSTQPVTKPTGMKEVGPLPSRETGDKTISPEPTLIVPVPAPMESFEGQ